MPVDEYSYQLKHDYNTGDQSTAHLSAFESGSVNDENFEDVNLYFGEEAKENFWDLYKSDRRFKDFDSEHDEIRDPRFAYLKTCRDLKVYPKARMVIRDKQTNHIDYSNYQMLDKTAVAVAEAVKRYSLPIESINLTNNCLKSKQCIMLIDSLQRHFSKLQNLKLSKNKLGLEGSKHLAIAIRQMKSLTSLDLSQNEIGDVGINEILNACKDYGMIEYLDISGNNIGKTSFSYEVADTMNHFIVNNSSLEILKMNWNNLRGQVGEKLIEGLKLSSSIREVHLNNNLLGVAYDDKQPPICKIAEFLSSSKNIEYLDLSYNFIEQKSIFCIAHGLKFTSSLKNITLEGNPLGPVGMRFLIQAMSINTQSAFKVNMKEISADRDIKIYKNVFDPNNPETTYVLNLAETYDHIILQSLLLIAEKTAQKSDGKFDIKQCFSGVKLNGKPSWSPPTSKDHFGQFEVQEHSGILTFTFTINPVLYKVQQLKLQQLQEQQAQQNPGQPLQASPQKQQQQEILELDFILKPVITHQAFERLVSMLIQCYQDEDDYNLEELIKNLAKEHMIWTSQAFEILYVFKNQEIFAKMVPYLINIIVDRPNRFYLLSHFGKQYKSLLSKLYKRMGQAISFSFWNPNGHYELNLSSSTEREVAMTLVVISKEVFARIAAGERADRSQMGNKSCFRNEKFNSQPFIMHNEWLLPQNGVLEFDFMSLIDRPKPEECTKDEQVTQLIEWLKHKYETEKIDVPSLALTFAAATEFLSLRSEQLAQFVDLIDDPLWKTEIYISGISRICDYRNYDFIKHRVKFPEAIRDIYKRFGILNLFNPFRPNGSYRLDLAIFEERTVCKMLLELAKCEGYQQFTNVSLDGKSTESINKEFADKLGDSGVFEGTYICLPANIKEDVREKLGQKYLDWEPL